MGTFGTSAGNSIAQTEYTDMVFESIPFRFNVMTCAFMWIVLAGFLVLPSSFPNIETILGDENELKKVVRVARNIPLYVPFFPPVPLFKVKTGSSGSFVHCKLTWINQQTCHRLHLLRHWRDRAVLPLVALQT